MNYIINNEFYTVSKLNASIKNILENSFGYIKVKGEISSLSQPSSGHIYFSLKDEKDVISAVCWKSNIPRLSFFPEEGKNVLIKGKISTYSKQSKVQILVNDIELEGEGDLLKLLEERKKKLLKEGIFDKSLKKSIPLIPNRIGVITSETGSVIKDIVHRISERYPLEIILYPVVVQGKNSAEQIINAIERFNIWYKKKDVEKNVSTIIIARGGGSLEDLMPFNDENLVRSISKSIIPIISAIGHDTDWTLCDNVCDLRAPTPTAAAEFSVPVKTDLIYKLKEKFNFLTKLILNKLETLDLKLEKKKSSIPNVSEEIQHKFQEIDWIEEKLLSIFKRLIVEKKFELNSLSKNINSEFIYSKIKELKKKNEKFLEIINLNMKNKIDKEKTILDQKNLLLQSLSYKGILKRGFAVVRKKKQIIKKNIEIKENEDISIELYDSFIYAKKIRN
ncbi:MAG: exodeoxyribonuclease VII large subunit [Rickettsiales bacterium]|nr:exodeoxyribonuclease VII large subunit [Rickettsiales bacterium]